MKRQYIPIAGLLLAAAALGAAGYKAGDNSDAAAFSRLKTLAGEWRGDTQAGKARIEFQLIAGGRALVALETGDRMPPMMTIYHMDGSRLMLTHYCMAGNQPRMRAAGFNPETGEIVFRFLDATNLPDPRAGHMHNAVIRVADRDHLAEQWEFYEGGGPKQTHAAEYTRVR